MISSRGVPACALADRYMRDTADIIPNMEYIRNAYMNELRVI